MTDSKDMAEEEAVDLEELYSSLNLAMTFWTTYPEIISEMKERNAILHDEIQCSGYYWSDHCRPYYFSSELTSVKFDEGDL